MGIGGEAQPQQTQSAVRPHQGLPSVSLFLSFISLFFIQNPVRRRTCRTHDATARERQRLRRILRWSPLRALNLLKTPFRGLPLEGDAFNSSNPLLSALFVSFRTHYTWGLLFQKLNYKGFMPNTCVMLPHVPFTHHYMHRYDLSFGQARLPGSCAYPYVPDCSARR